MITIRSEKPEDYQGIEWVNDLAFKRKAEGKLVEEIRKLPEFEPKLSIVAIADDQIVGHTLFLPVLIKDEEKNHQTLTLAPMSVMPEYQKKSIGKMMIIFGLQLAKDLDYKSVVVLGHPSYYPKLGFKFASKWNIKSPFPAPNDAFMAIELEKGGLDDIRGTVIFPAPFDDV
jgi:putative acetyltransferase